MVTIAKTVPTTLIISDIFGLTPNLSHLANKLSTSQKTLILDPLSGRDPKV